LSTFSNLTPDTLYRYRLYRITQRGFSLAETSNWFSTYAGTYILISESRSFDATLILPRNSIE